MSLSGKTAIRRALEWVATNRPSGFKFNSNFTDGKATEVIAQFDNHEIALKKLKSKAEYRIENLETGEANRFSKMGTSVPDVISRKVNLSEVNVQDQLEKPFLITSTSGEITKVINETLQIEKLDKWQAKTTKKINSINKWKKIYIEDIERIEEDIKKLDGIEAVGKKINKLNKTSALIDRLTKKYNKIVDVLDEADKLSYKLEQLNGLQKVKGKVKQLLRVRNRLEKLSGKISDIDSLTEVKQKIKAANKDRIKTARKYINKLKRNKNCPTCFEKITDKTIGRIKNEIHTS